MHELGGKDDKPPELLAVVRLPDDRLDRIPAGPDMLVVVFDRPASPGNIGTLVRSADAFGASGVIITGHAADPYDPKPPPASKRPESCAAASCAVALSSDGLSGLAGRLPRRVRVVPAPPPPATIATGMISMPSFSYGLPNARRTERLSDVFAKRFSTSIPSASRPARLGTDVARVCLLHRNQFDPEVTQPVEQAV
jgi:SpoU rRNA Methylase family